MDLLIIWLIITPLFFAFGWIAGRIDMKTVLKQAKQMPQRIFDSFDAIIDNKTGIASDELKQVVEQEPQLVELQFSLGRIYRKRGENDLAINLHTRMLTSQYVFSNDTKDKIRLELARDFQRAGLIDRSESLLIGLLDNQVYGHEALHMLLLIYQQDKNWKEAIDITKKLSTSDYSYHVEVAEFNCELAQGELIKSHYEEAKQYANMALEINRKCVRANILLGEVYFNQGLYQDAINIWQLIEKQNYNYLPLVVDRMFEAYARIGKIKECLTLIKGYVALFPTLNMHDFVYNKLLNHDTFEATLDYLRKAMINNPNSKIAALLIDAQLDLVPTIEGKADASRLKTMLLKYNDKLSAYKCGCCNFKAKTFFWQCPACYSWESINPNNVEF